MEGYGGGKSLYIFLILSTLLCVSVASVET